MIMKCPNCGGALEYDVESKKLLCKFCLSYFEPDDYMEEDQKVETKVDDWQQEQSVENDDEYMETDIYSCTACGAELMINNVEASTFCAYCGQPTIVFNRVSKCRKPQYILPFKVSKDEALKTIRAKINKGFFVPDEIKNFKVEMLRGIYVPFWLYDVDYKDRMVIKGEVGSGKSRHTKYFYRKASCHLENVTLDASKRFNDISSQRLEPFHTELMVPFQADYLSGFYADCGDDDKSKMDRMAITKTRELFNHEVLDSVSASDKSIIYTHPEYTIEKKPDYALLPVWFLVFRIQQTFYTIMVNGQTGKIVGAVPSDKKKENMIFTVLSIICGLICGLISSVFMADASEDSFKLLIVGVFLAIFAFGYGKGVRNDYEKSQKLTTERAMKDLVAERQDGE